MRADYKEIVRIGDEFKYRDMCRKLDEKFYSSGNNGQIAQLKEWERFFDFEKKEEKGRVYIVKNVYETPLPVQKNLRNSIFSEDIRALLLAGLANAIDGQLVLTNRITLEGLGMVNSRYFEVKYKTMKEMEIYKNEIGVALDSLSDFFEKNRYNFSDRVDRATQILRRDCLIENPNKTYVVMWALGHTVASKQQDEVITRCRRIIMERMKCSTMFEINNNEKLKSKFDYDSLGLINTVFNKLDLDKIDGYYNVTVIKALSKQQVLNAIQMEKTMETLKSLNQKIADNILYNALKESDSEENRLMYRVSKNIEYTRIINYGKYLEDREHDEINGIALEDKIRKEAHRGNPNYLTDMEKLVKDLIILTDVEIEKNRIFNFDKVRLLKEVAQLTDEEIEEVEIEEILGVSRKDLLFYRSCVNSLAN